MQSYSFSQQLTFRHRWNNVFSPENNPLHDQSLAIGTDVCCGFVGGNPLLPVYGEIQCRLLGCKVEAFDKDGRLVYDRVGEMMLLEPMSSLPLYFWNDPGGQRDENSYFADNK